MNKNEDARGLPTCLAFRFDQIAVRIVAAACLATLLLTGFAGCSGCRQDPLVKRKNELKEKEKKEKEKAKEDFEIKTAEVVPGEEQSNRPLAKPRHWVTVAHEVKANNFHFRARLHTAVTDSQGRAFDVRNTQFQLSTSCPATLPKGQKRRFETTYFIPGGPSLDGKQLWLNRELRSARGGRLVGQPDRVPIKPMPGYQYHLVVLSSDPDRYGYLKRLPCIASPTSRDFNTETHLYYQVLLPQIENVAPLPSHSLTWTSIGYLVWDDVPVTVLTPKQQQALTDWLHWGGQLIVSGPNTLDKLKGTFLEAYLPALSEESIEIDQSAIEELNNNWSIKEQDSDRVRSLPILPEQPLVGVALLKHEDSVDLPGTGGLVVERRVGQGRVVLTAVSLTNRAFMKWGSFDSFFNGCLLRRPRRQFESKELAIDAYWADYPPAFAQDSRFITTLRYFSRDVGHFPFQDQRNPTAVEPEDAPELIGTADLVAEEDATTAFARAPDPVTDDWHLTGFPKRIKFGMAAWNPDSGVADAARESLKDAAGISIPQGSFVLRVLAVYLMVLAPLNWLFFRLLGRVELAWVAAPLIAIVGAFAVIRLAQLDIGFASSVTEVAVAEVHADYPRAHVARFSALYTSLSTPYSLVFDDESSVAQPFGTAKDYVRSPHDATYKVALDRDRKVQLNGFRVPSNKTGVVHCEQMCDLGGVFRLLGNDSEGYRVVNQTAFDLQSVGLFHVNADGQLHAAWLGDLKSNSTLPIQFQHLADNRATFDQWHEDATTLSYGEQAKKLLSRLDRDEDGLLSRDEAMVDAEIRELFDRLDANLDGSWNSDELMRWCRKSRSGEVSLGQVVEIASQNTRLRPGEFRLIGWTDQVMPGLQIKPAAAQVESRTLLLVHLKKGVLSAPAPDLNALADVMPKDQPLTDAEVSGENPTPNLLDDLLPRSQKKQP